MLQEVSDNRVNADIFAEARHTCLQTADAAHYQLDLYSGAGRLIQARNNLPVTQGVHLRHDVGRFALSGPHGFSADHADAAFSQPQRSQDQAVPGRRLGVTGQHVEHCGRVLTDQRMAGYKAAVRIELCGGVVVVSGSQMDITADAVFLAAYHQCDLAVGL